MTDSSTTKKKTQRRRDVAPVPDEAFTSCRLSLFQGFLANTDDEREALSNAVNLRDSIPRYAVSRSRMNAMRTAEGFLDVLEVSFNYRGRPLTAIIYPARIRDKEGRRLSYYPSAREELIEHALTCWIAVFSADARSSLFRGFHTPRLSRCLPDRPANWTA
jgi:hypothetical protein